jgi:hypothetical protein
MVTYIYFVKCPNCEDEPFDFFDEAKEFALGCLSQKPIITQTEVCRNDFGECTDSADLGTIWSWEDTMKDTEAEPAESVFTKDDLKTMADGKDPEFDELDNSVDFKVEEPETPEVSSVEKIPDNFRKPVPADMTIEELVEEMEENEDEVECTWCNDLFDKSECRKEVNLGWLCSRCEAAIKSRGEPLTFRENNYWDFLDEDTKRDPFDHHDPDYDEDESADYLADLVDGAKDDLYDRSLDTLEEASLSDIAAAANSEFGTDFNERDLLDYSGVEDEDIFDDIETPEDVSKELYAKRGINAFGGKKAGSKLEELEEAADYELHLTTCPDCGADKAFDHETGICINCGFSL